jgi:hypothetical protein
MSLERYARAIPKPRPLWYWILVRGTCFALLLLAWDRIVAAFQDSRRAAEGTTFHTLLAAAKANFTSESLLNGLSTYILVGFLFGLLLWVPDYKRSERIHK